MEDCLNEKSFKILVVGAKSVGKTSFIKRFVEGRFSEDVASSPCVNYYYRRVVVEDSILVHIYDAPSSPQYRNLTNLYFKSMDAIVILYDVSDSDWETRTLDWLQSVKREAQSNTVICVVGNKKDVVDKTGPVFVNQNIRVKADLHYVLSCKYQEGLGTNEHVWFDIISLVKEKEQMRPVHTSDNTQRAKHEIRMSKKSFPFLSNFIKELFKKL